MGRRIFRSLWCMLCIFLSVAAAWNAEAQKRMVFAHYMVTNQDYAADNDPTQEKKIAAYEREIRQAQAAGIDGFALNVGGWLHQPYYIRYTAQMFEAARRLNSGFKLMFSADMCCGNTMADVEDMMRRFAGNPRYANVYFQQDGRSVLTTFAGSKLGPAAWEKLRSDLLNGTNPSTTVETNVLAPFNTAPSNKPLRIFFVPAFFFGGEIPSKSAIEAGVNEWTKVIDGAFYWGIAGVPDSHGALDTARSSADYASVLHAHGKLYMAPVCLQFWGSNANRYYEYSGAKGMRALWRTAIASKADWVEIITWNDFIEGTYVSPIDDPNKYSGANFLTESGVPTDTLNYFHSHAGATALLPYFIHWYKTGEQPKITRDELFYFYRTQPMHVAAPTPPVAHMYGPVANDIYMTAQMTAPATLIVTSGSLTTTRELPPGSSDIAVPFDVGAAPHFVVRRGQKVVIEGNAKDAIDGNPKYKNFYYATGILQ